MAADELLQHVADHLQPLVEAVERLAPEWADRTLSALFDASLDLFSQGFIGQHGRAPFLLEAWHQILEPAARLMACDPAAVISTVTNATYQLAAQPGTDLGAQHVVVDKARQLVPVSGTAIREQPGKHWQYLPRPVRPYFLKRVAVYGPESTGKTTLCAQLAAHFGTVWVSEYARGLLDHRGSTCEPSDIPVIARGQIAAEEALALQAHQVLFCDTELLTTTIYSRHYFGDCPAWIFDAAEARTYDLYLFTDIDVPWVEDPQRDLGHRREEMRQRFLEPLQRLGRPYVIPRRLARAIRQSRSRRRECT